MEQALGIDVSHYEGEVDWHAVAGGGFSFAYAKATEGNTHVDSQFRDNWEAIREAGLLRGAYHFARPGGDPATQAAFFAATVGAPSWGELPPVLDLEVADGHSAADVIQWTLDFVRAAESLFGRPLMIYTGGLWRRDLGNPDVPELRTRLLWTARYGTNEPVVPRTWTRWDFWQFTDGNAGQVMRVPGVSGGCDVNRFRGDLAELKTLASGLTNPPAQPPPVVDPTTPRPAWPGRYFVWPATPTIAGQDVTRWQNAMRQRGYPVEADGIYGPESRNACLSFQREVGLTPDGIVGAKTWDATFDPAVA
jgi:lysozyme